MGRGPHGERPVILDDAVLSGNLEPTMADWDAADNLTRAAVLAGLFRREGQDWLLFTERHADLPQHPGQISFPGGAREGEESPVSCALRETEEEVGLRGDCVTLLGALPTRISTSYYRVHALVGRFNGDVDLRPDSREVASILTVPLSELMDESRWSEREYTGREGIWRTPQFFHESHEIWGLTGRLTRDLIAAIRSPG